ncbi:MAG: hypothetical protein R2880_18520 [Deinococcales bacterium]
MSAGAAVIASLIPIFAAFGQLFWLSRQQLQETHKLNLVPKAEIIHYSLAIFIQLAAQALWLYSDSFIVNARWPQDSGLYAALVMYGRMIFFLAYVLGLWFFPRVAQLGDQGFRLLKQALVITLALLSLPLLASLFGAKVMLALLLGQEFLVAAAWLWPYSLMMSLYALAHILLNHALAMGKVLVGYLSLALALLQVIFLSHFAQFDQVIWGQFVLKGVLLVLLIGFLYLWPKATKAKRSFH